jgi:hypothetical protein
LNILKIIKKLFCRHKFVRTKHYESHDFMLGVMGLDIFYNVCTKCDYVDLTACDMEWSKAHLDYLRSIGQKWVVGIKSSNPIKVK